MGFRAEWVVGAFEGGDCDRRDPTRPWLLRNGSPLMGWIDFTNVPEVCRTIHYVHQFQGVKDQQVLIEVFAQRVEARVYLLNADGQIVDQGVASEPGRFAQIFTVLPETGTYFVASGVSVGDLAQIYADLPYEGTYYASFFGPVTDVGPKEYQLVGQTGVDIPSACRSILIYTIPLD